MNKKGVGNGLRTNYEESKSVFKGPRASSGKPERYSQDSFIKSLIGKVLKINLINGNEISGRLIDLGMYDCKVQTSNGPVIILKSAISTVEVPE